MNLMTQHSFLLLPECILIVILKKTLGFLVQSKTHVTKFSDLVTIDKE